MVVDIRYSGISTGTEKLFWSGQMPPFPGMGYPLVPGYEAAGEVVEAGSGTGLSPGDIVFVPGASCYGDVKGLFGGATNRLVTAADRAVRIDPSMGPEGALLALAATARHAVAGINTTLPELIVGHGVFRSPSCAADDCRRRCRAHGVGDQPRPPDRCRGLRGRSSR
jgi:3-hydroxyethyl bacteriochlorophyllide a dehydrogenase